MKFLPGQLKRFSCKWSGEISYDFACRADTSTHTLKLPIVPYANRLHALVQSALFNLSSLTTVLLLLICICTYIRGYRKGIFDAEDGSHHGLRGDTKIHVIEKTFLRLFMCYTWATAITKSQ